MIIGGILVLFIYIYIYIYINIYVGQAKDLSATLYVGDRWTEGECEVGVSIQRVITSK